MLEGTWFRRSMAGVGLLISLAACGAQSPDPVERLQFRELRSYEVPREYRDELRSMLEAALSSGAEHERVANVTNGPGSTLLVTASARIHRGVEQVLSADLEIPATGPATLTYWFLAGRPLDGVEGSAPYSVIGRQVPVLDPVLEQVADAHGATEFALLEEFQLSSLSQYAEATGRLGSVSQSARRSGNQVVADVEAELTPHSFQSRVALEDGQFLVLGYVGFNGEILKPYVGPELASFSTLYCIITADFVP